MSRHFEPITQEQLARKIIEAWNAHEDNQHDLIEDPDTINPISTVENLGGYNIRSLTPKIQADISKVSFDFENCDCAEGFGYGGLCGLHTLPNGLTYLGVTAGGDWEYPVFFIIYWNGKSLRAYVPKKGNLWNYKTKEALGNDEDADKEFLKKALGPAYVTDRYDGDIHTNAQLLEDATLIVEDIVERIKKA